MQRLTLNGESIELQTPCSLADALTRWGRTEGRFAVAVDGRFVPKSQYDHLQLAGGESIELLAPMQGG
jgi:sulfur carrier protein